MSQPDIRVLLEARVATLGWETQTAWENKAFKPTVGTAYQEVTTVFAEPDAITLSDSDVLRGLFQVRLLYPLDKGTSTAFARAKTISDAFPRNLTLPVGGPVQVKITRAAHITSGGKEGDRDVTLVRVRFSDR